MNEQRLQKLCDESDIREVLTRYCRAIDRCDIDLLKSVYWPDASDDHVIFVGNAMEFADTMIPMMQKEMVRTLHSISNCWIKTDGDVANAETYIHAYHRMADTTEVVVSGRYLDRLERRNGEWRIAERKFVMDQEQNAVTIMGADTVKKALAVGKPSGSDDSYRLFANQMLN